MTAFGRNAVNFVDSDSSSSRLYSKKNDGSRKRFTSPFVMKVSSISGYAAKRLQKITSFSSLPTVNRPSCDLYQNTDYRILSCHQYQRPQLQTSATRPVTVRRTRWGALAIVPTINLECRKGLRVISTMAGNPDHLCIAETRCRGELRDFYTLRKTK